MTISPHISAAALLIAACATPAFAHHSGSMFDPSKSETVTGTVKAFNWTNPHVTLEVVTDQGPLPIGTWVLEASSPGVMVRSGWDKRSLNAGDKVTVTISPLRSGAMGGSMRKVVTADGKVLTFSTSALPTDAERK